MSIPVSTKKKDAGRIPGPANIPNVVEIRVQFMMTNSKPASIFFHGYNGGTAVVGQSMANTLWGSISSAWNTNLASLAAAGPPAAQLQNVYIRDMTSYTNPVFVGTGTAILGTSASPSMPANVAAVLTENINARGRGAKGRVYLPCWATNADGGGGVMTGAAQTAVNAFGTAIYNGIGAVNLTPCVANPARAQYQGVTGTVHAARSATHTNINSYTCRDTIWDTQRRRIQL